VVLGSRALNSLAFSSAEQPAAMRGSQIVYCSPMTHGPFSSLRSISSKHSVMVAHTLTLHRLDRRGDALCRHAAPRFAGHRRYFRDAEKMGLDQNPRKTTLTLS